MKLSEAWRLSKVPYQEVVYQSLAEERGHMWWGAFGRTRPGKEEQDDFELAKRALRIARFDKGFVTVFNVAVAIVPFAAMLLGGGGFGLASSISLSLAVTFGLMTLYSIQTLSSFVGAGSSTLLSILPIGKEDFSLLTLFSFVRSVDFMVAGAVIGQTILVGYVTGSILAALVMFGASVMNAVFAIAISLWFSRIFQRNLLRGGRSKTNSLMRIFFILMWGTLLVGVGFLFSIPWYIVPAIENALVGVVGASSLLMGLLYPFSTGIVIMKILRSNIPLTLMLLSSAALAAYALLALSAGKWSINTVKSITENSGSKIIRVRASDFSLKTRRPILAYITKDLKVAAKNPGTAFFFALPVLETLIITLFIANYSSIRVSLVLTSSLMGGVFALFLPLALLTVEGKGLEYTKTLPVSSSRIIVSKALVSAGAYAFVPLVLAILALFKPPTTFSSVFIPLFIMAAVFAASVFEIKLFFRTVAQSRIASIATDIEKLFVGLLTILVPEIVYGVAYLLLFNYGISVLLMGATVLAELSASAYVLRRSL